MAATSQQEDERGRRGPVQDGTDAVGDDRGGEGRPHEHGENPIQKGPRRTCELGGAAEVLVGGGSGGVPLEEGVVVEVEPEGGRRPELDSGAQTDEQGKDVAIDVEGSRQTRRSRPPLTGEVVAREGVPGFPGRAFPPARRA